MAKRKKLIPDYGTTVIKGVEYYRTRIEDADGKRVALYALTPEELYEKVEEAKQLIKDAKFRKRILRKMATNAVCQCQSNNYD